MAVRGKKEILRCTVKLKRGKLHKNVVKAPSNVPFWFCFRLEGGGGQII